MQVGETEEGEDQEFDYEINMETSSDDKGRVRYKRIYDAKYKIPPQQKLKEINIQEILNNSEKVQKRIAIYKKYSNSIITALMGFASLCMILMYLY